MSRIASAIIVLGSLLLLAAAFSPISMAFFTERNAARQLEIASGARSGWITAQTLFLVGTVVTASGLGLVAYSWRMLAGSTEIGTT